MLIYILLLIAGLVLLVKFSMLAIDNAVKLSKLTKISTMTIGFILIAVSTSLPELAIAVISSAEGEGLLSFGNLVGSNISNILLIFGFLGLYGVKISRSDMPEISQAVVLTTIVAFFILVLGRIDFAFGIFLFALFYMFSKAVMSHGIRIRNRINHRHGHQAWKLVFYVVVSILFVVLGAHLVTIASSSIASHLGIAESIIGATILALGTTLPEFTVGIAAVKKGNISLAIGDGIGSIIVNLTLILGIVSVINPITPGITDNIATTFLILGNLIFLFLAERLRFGKTEGFILLSSYALYLVLMIRLAVL